MELTDIMALVRAGYTKDEIAQMEAPGTSEPIPAPAPVATPEPIPAPVDVPVAVAEPTAVPQQQPQPAQAEPSMAELMQSIAKLTSAVQANAIAQSVIPGGTLGQGTPTAEDMLAEIIRPTYKPRSD